MTDTDFGGLGFEQKDKVKIVETAKGKLHFELTMLTLDVKEIEKKIIELNEMCGRNSKET